MADTSLILDAIVAVSIAAGAMFAIAELRLMARDRQTQIISGWILWSTQPEVSENFRKVLYSDFKNRKEAEEKCGYAALDTVATYYTGVGTLIRRKLVNADLAFDFMWIHLAFEHLKPWLVETPFRHGTLEWWRDFEYAAELDQEYKEKKMRKLSRSRPA